MSLATGWSPFAIYLYHYLPFDFIKLSHVKLLQLAFIPSPDPREMRFFRASQPSKRQFAARLAVRDRLPARAGFDAADPSPPARDARRTAYASVQVVDSAFGN